MDKSNVRNSSYPVLLRPQETSRKIESEDDSTVYDPRVFYEQINDSFAPYF